MMFRRKLAILVLSLVIILLVTTNFEDFRDKVFVKESTATVSEAPKNTEALSPMTESSNGFENVGEKLKLEPNETEVATEVTTTELSTEPLYKWQGEVLNAQNGTIEGPSGKETYYNLDMSGVIAIMESFGYDYEYHIREDGVKMYGSYVMCAANLDLRPRGTIIETSLGLAIVCDTGGFAENNPTQIDIAVDW